MNEEYRIERDSMGEMRVPIDAMYGAQTARALENFPISGQRFPRAFIRSLGLVKKHAALVNSDLGQLEESLASAISEAADEVACGRWDDQFVLDIFQTGSGTSTNMNANEVIAHRAGQLMSHGSRDQRRIHPNDHVNRGQSSNDVIPTVIHLAALEEIERRLVPALEKLKEALRAKAQQFAEVMKIGRTHLQDATPIRLGQEFGGYARQMELGIERLRAASERLSELALGGTAVGTGMNTHPEFAGRVIAALSQELNLPLREAADHFEAQSSRDACVEMSGALRVIAVSLTKIANDIRWLGSGPRCGIGEIKIPATQPGSSIMPGKVNPVIAEAVLQVAAQVIGNDAAIAFAGAQGNFELNVMMPVIARNLLESIALLSRGTDVFADKCVAGLEANEEWCAAQVEKSLAMCTSLVPEIGYDRAAEIAKKASATGRTIREVAMEETELSEARVRELLDPRRQTGDG